MDRNKHYIHERGAKGCFETQKRQAKSANYNQIGSFIKIWAKCSKNTKTRKPAEGLKRLRDSRKKGPVQVIKVY